MINSTETELDEMVPDPDKLGDIAPSHTHWLWGRVGPAATNGPDHASPLGFAVVHSHPPDVHRISGPNHNDAGEEELGFNEDPQQISINGGQHRHLLTGKTQLDSLKATLKHATVDTSKSTVGSTGADNGTVPRVGDVLTFLGSLDISIDGRPPSTTAVLEQIRAMPSTADPNAWNSLGNGASNSAFVLNGTGPIRLDFLPDTNFDEGEHFIEFSVPLDPTTKKANGGKVIYNLYIE